MSHTSEISAVAIVDIAALEGAVSDLKASGVRCSLVKNAKPRAFYNNQQGMGVAPYVLKLEDSPYDVGFYENGQGGYVARTDLFAGHIQRILGTTVRGPKETAEQAALGKLYQTYAVNAAIRQAPRLLQQPARHGRGTICPQAGRQPL